MKKIAAMLVLIVLCSVSITANASAATVSYNGSVFGAESISRERASLCISQYGNAITPLGGGKLDIYSFVDATRSSATSEGYFVLQVVENGAWRTVKTWNASASGWTLHFSNTYQGTAGKTYRFIATFSVTVGTTIDTRSVTTTVTAK